MPTVVLGYPGTGLPTWVSQLPADEVRYVGTFDLAELQALPSEILHYVAPLTVDAVQQCTDAKIGAVLIYPSVVAISEYKARQIAEGLAEAEVDKTFATFTANIQDIRSVKSARHRHIVLGRQEYVYDYASEL